jgi:hypothetical protein
LLAKGDLVNETAWPASLRELAIDGKAGILRAVKLERAMDWILRAKMSYAAGRSK